MLSRIVFLAILLMNGSMVTAAVYEFNTDQTLSSQGWLPNGGETVEASYLKIGSLDNDLGGQKEWNAPPFDEFVYEFRLKLIDYTSPNGDCWAHPIVNVNVNNEVRQFRPNFCGRGEHSYILIYDASNREYRYEIGPFDDAFHTYRFEGNFESGSFFRDGQFIFNSTLSPLPSSYPYRNPFITLGESTSWRASYQLSGVCFATDGDDCSVNLGNDREETPIVDHLATPTLYDNAVPKPLAYGQSFIANGMSITSVEVYVGDPTRRYFPTETIKGQGTLEVWELSNSGIQTRLATQVFDGSESVYGEILKIDLATPLPTKENERYAFLLFSDQFYGLGLRNQQISTYSGGSQVAFDGAFINDPYRSDNQRDLSFRVNGVIPEDDDGDGDNGPTIEIEFMQGIDDTFALDIGTEQMARSQGFESYLSTLAAPLELNFDRPVTNRNRGFSFEFEEYKGSISGALLQFRARPIDDFRAEGNDQVYLSYYDDTGFRLLEERRIGFGVDVGPNNYFPFDWQIRGRILPTDPALGFLIELDLADFATRDSNSDSILEQLNVLGGLDVLVSDDTDVDFAKLTLRITSLDQDKDGIDDADDNCPQVPNPNQLDTDGDAIGNACDPDDDNDGVQDDSDNCPLLVNPTQLDNDNDSIGDVCDPDDDNDNVDDTDDNCPFTQNSDQFDFDGDGLGDVCDPDADGDGVDNDFDQCPKTDLGQIVNAVGCSIPQLCPCNSPTEAIAIWKNHGEFVSCVARTSKVFVLEGLISKQTRSRLVRDAAQSSCGIK